VINSYLFHFSVLLVRVTTFPKICIWLIREELLCIRNFLMHNNFTRLITYVIARDFSPYVFHFHLIFAAGDLYA
jgi:hypothetical protein